MATADIPIKSFALPASVFPFTVEFISVATGKIVHTLTISGAGIVPIPALEEEYGPIDTRVTLADGQVMHAIDGWPA